MTKLTPAQDRVLTCIKDFITAKGHSPTRVEIADLMGFKSATAASNHLLLLVEKNAVSITPMVNRGIVVL